MGKLPNRRPAKKARVVPTEAVQNLSLSDNPIIQALASDVIQSNKAPVKEEVSKLIEKFSDPDASNRAWAASVVSTVASNDLQTRKSLLASNVLGHLISLLADPAQEVVVEALGTLRNLASLGDPGIPSDLFNKKIFTTFHKLMDQVGKVILEATNPDLSQEKQSVDVITSSCAIAESIISILWSMAETSTKLLNQVSQDKELEFMMLCLSISPDLPVSLADTTARCLLTISENNKDLFRHFFLKRPSYLRKIESVFQFSEKNSQAHSLVRVLAAGVLSNFHSLISPYNERQALNDSELTSLILFSPGFYATLLPVVSENIRTSSDIAILVDKALQQNFQENNGLETSKDIQLNDAKFAILSDALNVITDHHVALEILASLISEEKAEQDSEQDPEQVPEQDETMDCDSECEDKFSDKGEDTINELGNNVAEDTCVSELDPLVIFALDNVVPKLQGLATSHALAVNQATAQPQHKEIIEALVGLHQRALTCLNNLFSTLSSTMSNSLRVAASQKYSDGIRGLWDFLFQQASAYAKLTSRTSDQHESLNQAIACLWSLARFSGHIPLVLSPDHIDFLFGLATMSPCSNVNITAVGVLGFIAQRRPGFIDLNKRIGDLMISLIKPLTEDSCQSFELALGALNAIYDIYDDKDHDYDCNFVNGNYISVLQSSIIPLSIKKRKIDRRKDRDLREHADGTLINLKAFVKYKIEEAQS